MSGTLFIATERFDPTDGEKWRSYLEWSKIPGLKEIVSLDSMLCRHLVTEFTDEDWKYIVNEDFRLDYFYDLKYLLTRVCDQLRRNVLGLYRNPKGHISTPPASGSFNFIGYDLIEEQAQISALTNCGGFPETFSNAELNTSGLLPQFDRANEVKKSLVEKHPGEPHANCELYAIWRLNE